MDFVLTQNLWERYGFRDNPFDTRALSLSPGSLLSVADAFVGRAMTSAERRGRNVYYEISPDLALLRPRTRRPS